MVIVIVLMLMFIIPALADSDEPTAWTFTCPHCLRQVTFSEYGSAEQCRREHKCKGG